MGIDMSIDTSTGSPLPEDRGWLWGGDLDEPVVVARLDWMKRVPR